MKESINAYIQTKLNRTIPIMEGLRVILSETGRPDLAQLVGLIERDLGEAEFALCLERERHRHKLENAIVNDLKRIAKMAGSGSISSLLHVAHTAAKL